MHDENMPTQNEAGGGTLRGAPAMGMPNSPELSMPETDQRRSSHVAALSPVQCATYWPDPGNVDLADGHALVQRGRQ